MKKEKIPVFPPQYSQRTKKGNKSKKVQSLKCFINVCSIPVTKRVTGIENQWLSSSPEEFEHTHAVDCPADRDER